MGKESRFSTYTFRLWRQLVASRPCQDHPTKCKLLAKVAQCRNEVVPSGQKCTFYARYLRSSGLVFHCTFHCFALSLLSIVPSFLLVNLMVTLSHLERNLFRQSNLVSESSVRRFPPSSGWAMILPKVPVTKFCFVLNFNRATVQQQSLRLNANCIIFAGGWGFLAKLTLRSHDLALAPPSEK